MKDIILGEAKVRIVLRENYYEDGRHKLTFSCEADEDLRASKVLLLVLDDHIGNKLNEIFSDKEYIKYLHSIPLSFKEKSLIKEYLAEDSQD